MIVPKTANGASWWPFVGLVARFGLAAVWFLSGIPKATDSQRTLVAIEAYRLFSHGQAELIAATLPFFELALGLLLLIGLATRLAAVLSAVLLVVFIAGVISAAARGLAIDCGCFGGGGIVAAGDTAYTAEILRDTGFLVMAGYLCWRPRSLASIDGIVTRKSAGDEQA